MPNFYPLLTVTDGVSSHEEVVIAPHSPPDPSLSSPNPPPPPQPTVTPSPPTLTPLPVYCAPATLPPTSPLEAGLISPNHVVTVDLSEETDDCIELIVIE